ncbi:hypothetical protein H0H92_006583 [Tricholoma furcatifolium]|nr:hypothetical protein H0H92_006583 [Tricholoma furcatifolium]
MSMTIDDESPLISYQPPNAWSQHNVSTDPIASNFYGETFTITNQANATMSLSFDGVVLDIYGSTNGQFVANIDGTNHYGSGNVTSAASSNAAVIFTVNNLDSGIHNVTFTNLDENSNTYIDYITWESSIANKTGALDRVIVDDPDPSFKYQEGVWSTSPQDLADFHDHTGHTTSTKGAMCNFTFASVSIAIVFDAVILYGSVGPDHGLYSVQLDDQPPRSYQGSQSTPAVGVALFFMSHIETGNHTLRIVNEENAVLDIDFVTEMTIENATVS